jgi:hypothetical protein
MPPQPGGMPPQPGGMPPQHGGMLPPFGGMSQSGPIPPQHGGSSFQPLMQPGPPAGKSYPPSPVSEYFICKREFMFLVPMHSLHHRMKYKSHN